MRERGHSWVSNSVNEGVTRFDYVFVSFLYFPKFRVFLVLFQRDSIQHCDKKIQMILFLSSQMPFLLGISAPLCADRLCSDSCSLEAKYTGTQYLTWFGKSPTSTGEVHIIRDREKIQYKYMEEEDHFTQTQLPALLLHLQLLPLQPFTFSFGLSLLCSLLCSNFAALSRCLFIGKNGATSSSSSSTMVAANLWHLG